MRTLTIDDIDTNLEHEISVRAEALGLSRTETVKRILSDALLGDKIDERRKTFASFEHLQNKIQINHLIITID